MGKIFLIWSTIEAVKSHEVKTTTYEYGKRFEKKPQKMKRNSNDDGISIPHIVTARTAECKALAGS